MTGDPVVVVPGDLDVEDRLVGPVTFRMAAWLAAAAAGVALIAAGHGAVPTTALGVLLVVVGVTGACWQPGGRPAAAWLAPMVAYRRRQRGRVTPEEDVAPAEPAVAMPDEIAVVVPDEIARPARRQWTRYQAEAVVVALAVVGGLAFARMGGGDRSDVPASSPTAADPAAPAAPREPVVVVVPVNPYTGWEVDDGDPFGLDPWCGC